MEKEEKEEKDGKDGLKRRRITESSFFQRDCSQVAKELLGKILVRKIHKSKKLNVQNKGKNEEDKLPNKNKLNGENKLNKVNDGRDEKNGLNEDDKLSNKNKLKKANDEKESNKN